MTDPIADMLIRIKNAGLSEKTVVIIPYSKLKKEILQVLKQEGYIENFTETGKGSKHNLEVVLKYNTDRTPFISDVKRISKPSRRIYIKNTEIHPYKKGFGSIIISTPQGIMTNKQAKKMHLGGEVLFEIY